MFHVDVWLFQHDLFIFSTLFYLLFCQWSAEYVYMDLNLCFLFLLLICLPTLLSFACCLNYCSFIDTVTSQNLFISFNIILAILVVCHSMLIFGSTVNIYQIIYWNLDWDCIVSVEPIVKNWYFDKIESSYQWIWNGSHTFSYLISFVVAFSIFHAHFAHILLHWCWSTSFEEMLI